MGEAYLDIETTGLSYRDCEITVVCIYLHDTAENKVIQLMGDKITDVSLLQALDGVNTIYIYNGSRFDLPFIYFRHKVNLALEFEHCDLMYHCWRYRLYGGLKGVERQLGISRRLKEVNRYEAVRLWWKYVNDYDMDALATLLEYNKEDVANLRALRDRLL